MARIARYFKCNSDADGYENKNGTEQELFILTE